MRTHLFGQVPPDLWARSPAALLDTELMQEQASVLGRYGRDLEAALRALANFDTTHPRGLATSPQDLRSRIALRADAGRALWRFIVQREACGFRDSRAVMEDYRVPPEVQHEMGMTQA